MIPSIAGARSGVPGSARHRQLNFARCVPRECFYDLEYISRVKEKNAVISNELLEYYESLVSYQGPAPAEENPHLREYVTECRAVWEARVILRDLRNRAGLATCSGEVDCLESPTSRCMRGEHPTCPDTLIVAISAFRAFREYRRYCESHSFFRRKTQTKRQFCRECSARGCRRVKVFLDR